MTMKRPASGRPRRRAARGASLVFAMITVVALSLAAVALVRSVDTGLNILGNLGFKQDTPSRDIAGDLAVGDSVATDTGSMPRTRHMRAWV